MIPELLGSVSFLAFFDKSHGMQEAVGTTKVEKDVFIYWMCSSQGLSSLACWFCSSFLPVSIDHGAWSFIVSSIKNAKFCIYYIPTLTDQVNVLDAHQILAMLSQFLSTTAFITKISHQKPVRTWSLQPARCEREHRHRILIRQTLGLPPCPISRLESAKDPKA